MRDTKYIVFRRADLPVDALLSLDPVEDAVVIRRQDVFAPPALDAYANAIQTVIEVLSAAPGFEKDDETIARLRSVADYFHENAVESWSTKRKLPD